MNFNRPRPIVALIQDPGVSQADTPDIIHLPRPCLPARPGVYLVQDPDVTGTRATIAIPSPCLIDWHGPLYFPLPPRSAPSAPLSPEAELIRSTADLLRINDLSALELTDSSMQSSLLIPLG